MGQRKRGEEETEKRNTLNKHLETTHTMREIAIKLRRALALKEAVHVSRFIL